MPGYSGINCTSLCPYPYYGAHCQRTCNCSRDLCNVSTGCIKIVTGKYKKQTQCLKEVNMHVCMYFMILIIFDTIF